MIDIVRVFLATLVVMNARRTGANVDDIIAVLPPVDVLAAEMYHCSEMMDGNEQFDIIVEDMCKQLRG